MITIRKLVLCLFVLSIAELAYAGGDPTPSRWGADGMELNMGATNGERPESVTLTDGKVVVCYKDGSRGVFCKIFSYDTSSGALGASNVILVTPDSDAEWQVANRKMSATTDGGFIVSWIKPNRFVYYREYNSNGSPKTAQQVLQTADGTGNPTIPADHHTLTTNSINGNIFFVAVSSSGTGMVRNIAQPAEVAITLQVVGTVRSLAAVAVTSTSNIRLYYTDNNVGEIRLRILSQSSLVDIGVPAVGAEIVYASAIIDYLRLTELSTDVDESLLFLITSNSMASRGYVVSGTSGNQNNDFGTYTAVTVLANGHVVAVAGNNDFNYYRKNLLFLENRDTTVLRTDCFGSAEVPTNADVSRLGDNGWVVSYVDTTSSELRYAYLGDHDVTVSNTGVANARLSIDSLVTGGFVVGYLSNKDSMPAACFTIYDRDVKEVISTSFFDNSQTQDNVRVAAQPFGNYFFLLYTSLEAGSYTIRVIVLNQIDGTEVTRLTLGTTIFATAVPEIAVFPDGGAVAVWRINPNDVQGCSINPDLTFNLFASTFNCASCFNNNQIALATRTGDYLINYNTARTSKVRFFDRTGNFIRDEDLTDLPANVRSSDVVVLEDDRVLVIYEVTVFIDTFLYTQVLGPGATLSTLRPVADKRFSTTTGGIFKNPRVVRKMVDDTVLLVFESRNILVTEDPSGQSINFARLSKEGILISLVEVANSNYRLDSQGQPAIATFRDGSQPVIVYNNPSTASTSGVNHIVAVKNIKEPVSPAYIRTTESLVNSHTTGLQLNPRSCTLTGGLTVVVWSSDAVDHFANVYMQVYSAAGIALFPVEVKVNDLDVGDQDYPDVSCYGNSFMIVWQSYLETGVFIYRRTYQPSGSSYASVGNSVVVNSVSAGGNSHPVIAAAASDTWAVCWEHHASGSDGIDVKLIGEIASVGQPMSVPHTTVTSTQKSPSIAMLGSGNMVITWQSHQQDGSRYGIYSRRYTRSASSWIPSSVTIVNDVTAGSQTKPLVAMFEDSGYVIVFGSIDTTSNVFGRTFNPTGTPIDSFVANVNAANNQRPTSVAILSGGSKFIVTWTTLDVSARTQNVYYRVFDRDGILPRTSDVLVNSRSDWAHVDATVTGRENSFQISWASQWQDGTRWSIYTSKFSLEPRLEIPAPASIGYMPVAVGLRNGETAIAYVDESDDSLRSFVRYRDGTQSSPIFVASTAASSVQLNAGYRAFCIAYVATDNYLVLFHDQTTLQMLIISNAGAPVIAPVIPLTNVQEGLPTTGTTSYPSAVATPGFIFISRIALDGLNLFIERMSLLGVRSGTFNMYVDGTGTEVVNFANLEAYESLLLLVMKVTDGGNAVVRLVVFDDNLAEVAVQEVVAKETNEPSITVLDNKHILICFEDAGIECKSYQYDTSMTAFTEIASFSIAVDGIPTPVLQTVTGNNRPPVVALGGDRFAISGHITVVGMDSYFVSIYSSDGTFISSRNGIPVHSGVHDPPEVMARYQDSGYILPFGFQEYELNRNILGLYISENYISDK